MTSVAFLLHVCLSLTTVLVEASVPVYFPRERQRLCLYSDIETGSLVGRVFAYPWNCSGNNLRFRLSGTDQASRTLLQNVTIDNEGWITAKRKIVHDPSEAESYSLTVRAWCKGQKKTKVSNSVQITMVDNSTSATTDKEAFSEDEIRELCFRESVTSFQVMENVQNVTELGRIKDCSQIGQERGISISYSVEGDVFSVDTVTSDVKLLRSLDREDQANFTFPLTCHVQMKDNTYLDKSRQLIIRVLDLNDNAPIFQDNDDSELFKSFTISDSSSESFTTKVTVLDKDDQRSDSYEVDILVDPKARCSFPANHWICFNPNVKRPTNAKELLETVCQLSVQADNLKTIDEVYSCQIIVKDVDLINKNIQNNSALLTLTFYNNNSLAQSQSNLSDVVKIDVDVWRNSSDLTRLGRLEITSDEKGLIKRYTAEDAVFGITSRSGILYLKDHNKLADIPDLITLPVKVEPLPNMEITLHMKGHALPRNDCDYSCARHKTAKECNGSCGLGITGPGCVMRGNETHVMSKLYQTCTYDTQYCPDGTCDELERLHPDLCPQDCTEKVIGAGLLDKTKDPAQGILRGDGTCWCDPWTECSCFQIEEPGDQQDVRNGRAHSQILPAKTPTTTNSHTYLDRPYDDSTLNSSDMVVERHVIALSGQNSEPCDSSCKAAICATLAVLGSLVILTVILLILRRKRQWRKKNIKHVGSVASMSAVQSDYLDERDRQASYSSPQWSPKGPIANTQYHDTAKWEFPRENLTLDKTLGEGEFGLVVRGKALGMHGSEGYTTVAVKMLKHYSAPSEEQDLWSEFNLLRDVSHPNVIKLLGICAGDDGPLYLIEEYCDHGCLLKYLRRSRLEENGYVNQRYRYRCRGGPTLKVSDREGDLLTIRDLLSFAWQIAKGMRYLSGIKLVHRDLAARNVLVAAGKMLRISDFGLTRDVYEADTYLKKSRGRIPVKWLAPESLYAQIYTTQSDVWSYGIVLWEIVTLGAPPYPGIPPERLYNLLIGGYRMDRPENCPDELYAVMQKCWKTDASDRPTFANLADIFDRILQERTGYLDLGSCAVDYAENDLYMECFNNRLQESGTSSGPNTSNNQSKESKNGLNSISGSLTSYLTPSSNRASDEIKSSPLFGKKNLIHPSEKLSLLIDSGTAKFKNAFETDDEGEFQETDLLRVEVH